MFRHENKLKKLLQALLYFLPKQKFSESFSKAQILINNAALMMTFFTKLGRNFFFSQCARTGRTPCTATIERVIRGGARIWLKNLMKVKYLFGLTRCVLSWIEYWNCRLLIDFDCSYSVRAVHRPSFPLLSNLVEKSL